MNQKINFKGYHTTSEYNAKKIKKSKSFIFSSKENEWLGKGVYFWRDSSDAEFWVQKSYKHENEMCIIVADISCDYEKYLNLDDFNSMHKFDTFVQDYTKELSSRGAYAPRFPSDAMTRCFFCELYKKRYNIDVISYSFPIGKISMSGFDKRRTQLCVSNNNCITITNYINRRKDDINVI